MLKTGGMESGEMAKTTSKKRSSKKTNPSQDGVEAALRLAGEMPWNDISLADIAAEAQVTEDDLGALFPTKLSIVRAFSRHVDEEVAARGTSISMDETMKDRLFEAMMIRLDVLEKHKDAVTSIIRATVPGNPKAMAAGATDLRRAMTQLLDLCGGSSGGLCGQVKLKALGLIYLSVLRVWLSDDTPDTGKTMAVLDKALARADSIMKSLPTSPLRRTR
ncbi:MAG: hypothetical protein P8J29_05075 [Rhodospirillales bacterium]|nr:hypothetical protein [Rhodospirillales bacterium]